jgi:fumarate hydratase, class II
VIKRLAERTSLPLMPARDSFAAQSSRDALVEVSSHYRTAAVALVKIANDLRWMGSGPSTGLAEIRIPDLQPGSSIMPGKVNPVIAEAVTQVAAQVIGNDAAVAFGGSQGAFELNVYMPMMARNVLESGSLLANVSAVFASRMIDGIEANEDVCLAYAESSPSIGTSLNPYIGYEKAAEVIKEASATGRSIREVVVEQGLMTDEEVDKALDIIAMTRGGIIR